MLHADANSVSDSLGPSCQKPSPVTWHHILGLNIALILAAVFVLLAGIAQHRVQERD
ncbi:MAG: hypothetical protein SGPRY_006575, partial [Prymnesium sp.]